MISSDKSEHIEILSTNQATLKVLKEKILTILIWILFSLVWAWVFLKFFSYLFSYSEAGPFILFLPVILFFIWLGFLYSKVRETFWRQIALKYNWEYRDSKNILGEKGLLFRMGHSPSTHHCITGDYNNQPFCFFEYEYTIGAGKYRTTHSFTVFEVKFTGKFPHLYLNHKGDWYSNPPSIFSSLAKIPVPGEFEKEFKFYAPKEYEIETLEIFTPDIFALLLDLKWNYDMEFVDGELIIYTKDKFHNFQDLDKEVVKIKKFVDALSPVLNKYKFTKIGDLPHSL